MNKTNTTVKTISPAKVPGQRTIKVPTGDLSKILTSPMWR